MKTSNLSDGQSDGFVIMYAKDKTIYPVALTKDQVEMLDMTLGIALSNEPVAVIFAKPMGEIMPMNPSDLKNLGN